MKCQEFRIHFDGVVVDVKLTFHRIVPGRKADGDGNTVFIGVPVTESVAKIKHGGILISIEKWVSGFLKSTFTESPATL